MGSTLAGMADDAGSPYSSDRRRAIMRAALMAPSPLARYQPAATRRLTEGDVVLTDGPHSRHVLVLGQVAPDPTLRLAEAFFGNSGGFTYELDIEAAGAFEDALRARGWQLEEEEPVLVQVPIARYYPPAP